MSLDTDIKLFLERMVELNAPRYETLTPTEARSAMAAARAAAGIKPPPVHKIRMFSVPGRSGAIAMRLYLPAPTHKSYAEPALIFFHGGGWVIGDLDSHDLICRRLALASKCRVFAVEYRLAPESKFPSALDDAIDATRWIFENAAALELDAKRIAVGGDSAGGNLAAVLALLSRDGALPPIAFQLLLYPVTDLTMKHPSYEVRAEGLPVMRETMEWFRGHYLTSEDERADWRASPLHAESVAGVAPAFILTVGYDPLADEGAAYAMRLREAGVRVVFSHYPGQIHGFLTVGAVVPTAGSAIEEIAVALKTGLSLRATNSSEARD
jgi:acetyl esterase